MPLMPEGSKRPGAAQHSARNTARIAWQRKDRLPLGILLFQAG
jgi:hypothetical protein